MYPTQKWAKKHEMLLLAKLQKHCGKAVIDDPKKLFQFCSTSSIPNYSEFVNKEFLSNENVINAPELSPTISSDDSKLEFSPRPSNNDKRRTTIRIPSRLKDRTMRFVENEAPIAEMPTCLRNLICPRPVEPPPPFSLSFAFLEEINEDVYNI